MKSKKPTLLISIPKPCSEDWEEMKVSQNGKFCSACEKEVIDFSNYSDKELYAYFLKAKPYQCGRLSTTQIDRFLQAPQINSHIGTHLFNRIAAILAIISPGPTPAKAENDLQPKLHFTNRLNDDLPSKGKIVTITGTVKNGQGKAIEGAVVYVDNTLMTKSDAYGRFSFELPLDTLSKLYTLSFGYPEMVTAIRNYHPVMESTSYDIILRREAKGSYTASYIGAITFSYIGLDSFTFKFKKASALVDNECKNELANLAVLLRTHPSLVIEFIGYGTTPKEKSLVKKRINAVIGLLENEEGISIERLKSKIEKGKFKNNPPIEVKPYE